jgi:hypothetical protein
VNFSVKVRVTALHWASSNGASKVRHMPTKVSIVGTHVGEGNDDGGRFTYPFDYR